MNVKVNVLFQLTPFAKRREFFDAGSTCEVHSMGVTAAWLESDERFAKLLCLAEWHPAHSLFVYGLGVDPYELTPAPTGWARTQGAHDAEEEFESASKALGQLISFLDQQAPTEDSGRLLAHMREKARKTQNSE